MPTPVSLSDQLADAERNLDRLLEWVSRYDSKSMVLIGVETGMVGVMASFARPISAWTCAMIWTVSIALGALLAGIALLYIGGIPRTRSRNASLYYFGSIAAREFRDFERSFVSQSAEERLGDLLSQCHRNSAILNRKFNCLKWSNRLLLAAAIPWAISVYLFRSAPALP